MATLLVLAGLSSLVHAQGFVPLVDKRFTYPGGIPYKVDTDVGLPRGEQLGYNICNSTTEGPTSLCQTAFINSLDDFCFWAPSEPGHTVGEIEGEMIAWCTQPGHGTRVMPDGTITGVQFTKTPDYVQVVGFMDQTKINMVGGDAGGEMDPHGADLRGNPMGGILFSRAFTGDFLQVVEWHNFMGSNQFCLKACDPRGRDDAKFCEHIFDTQGCGFNAPSNARDGVFESCAGDNQAFPGAPPVVPSSSLCSTFASTDIFGGGTQVPLPVVTIPPQGVATTPAPIPTTTATTTRTRSTTSASGTSSHSSNSVGPSVDNPAPGPSRPATSSPTDTSGSSSQSPAGPTQTSGASILNPSALFVAPIVAVVYMFL